MITVLHVSVKQLLVYKSLKGNKMVLDWQNTQSKKINDELILL